MPPPPKTKGTNVRESILVLLAIILVLLVVLQGILLVQLVRAKDDYGYNAIKVVIVSIIILTISALNQIVLNW